MEEHISYFDFLRGIAIIMVIAIHTINSVYAYENINIIAVVLRQIMNCAVPIFCVSGAYFLIDKNITKENYLDFLRKHILRVYLPVLFCSLPYFTFDIYKNQNIIKAILKFFTCSYSVYYFAAVIIQVYILLPLFLKIKIFQNVWLGLFLTLAWVSLYIYIVMPNYNVPLILYGGPIICFIVYFSLGSSIKKYKVQIKNSALYLIILVALVLSVFESYVIINRTKTLSGIGLKSTSVLFSVAVCFLLYKNGTSERYKENIFTSFISILGKFSYGIYLTHLYIFTVLKKILFRFNLFTKPEYFRGGYGSY